VNCYGSLPGGRKNQIMPLEHEDMRILLFYLPVRPSNPTNKKANNFLESVWERKQKTDVKKNFNSSIGRLKWFEKWRNPQIKQSRDCFPAFLAGIRILAR
jgi:hypothetical protein